MFLCMFKSNIQIKMQKQKIQLTTTKLKFNKNSQKLIKIRALFVLYKQYSLTVKLRMQVHSGTYIIDNIS